MRTLAVTAEGGRCRCGAAIPPGEATFTTLCPTLGFPSAQRTAASRKEPGGGTQRYTEHLPAREG